MSSPRQRREGPANSPQQSGPLTPSRPLQGVGLPQRHRQVWEKKLAGWLCSSHALRPVYPCPAPALPDPKPGHLAGTCALGAGEVGAGVSGQAAPGFRVPQHVGICQEWSSGHWKPKFWGPSGHQLTGQMAPSPGLLPLRGDPETQGPCHSSPRLSMLGSQDLAEQGWGGSLGQSPTGSCLMGAVVSHAERGRSTCIL